MLPQKIHIKQKLIKRWRGDIAFIGKGKRH